MAGVATIARVLLLLALLPSCSLGATLYTEKDSRTMRREPRSIHMSSFGEMTQAKKTKLPIAACTDFVMGKDDDVNCTDMNNHTLVTSKDECVEAASRSGATDKVLYDMAPADEIVSPLGCFKKENAANPAICADRVCYFYNDVATLPAGTAVSGTPVCSRPKILTGAPGVGGGCPTGYQVLEGAGAQEECISAAGCLDKALPQMPNSMLVGWLNASKHLDYPSGCFIDITDDHVYFNAPNSMGAATSVTGTSICVPSATVSWRATAAVTVTDAPGL